MDQQVLILSSCAALICALVQLKNSLTQQLIYAVMAEGRRRRRLLVRTASMTFHAPFSPARPARRCWMRVRSKDWWERVVLKEFTDTEWRDNFRMSRGSFVKLCGMMEGVLSPRAVTVRAPLPLEMRVAVVLFKLSLGAEYNAVGDRFGVHKSTVKKFVYVFCKGMVSSVIQELVKVPTAEEARAIARRFETAHRIPQVLGCVLRAHIRVSPPSDGYDGFVNSSGWPSYVLQAVVDDTYRFMHVNCKLPGSAHNADVLWQSSLFEMAHLLPKSHRELQGKPVGLFLLGDSGCPLLEWLIRGYSPRWPAITPEQESFNVYLSAARATAETAFARLKSRWAVLLKRSDFHYTFTPYVAATCCALHNFCENEEEPVHPSWVEEVEGLGRGTPQPGVCTVAAEDTEGLAVRQALTDYMAHSFPLLRRPRWNTLERQNSSDITACT